MPDLDYDDDDDDDHDVGEFAFAGPGTCAVCGCTDEDACPGGCVWANAAATLCSRCAR